MAAGLVQLAALLLAAAGASGMRAGWLVGVAQVGAAGGRRLIARLIARLRARLRALVFGFAVLRLAGLGRLAGGRCSLGGLPL